MEHTVVPATVDHRESGAVVYGPLVLAVDSRYGHSIHETELLVREQAVRTTFLEQEIEIMEKVVRPENRTDDSLAPVVRFEAPGLDRGEKKIVTLVDYASAGSFAPGVDRFKVWIPMVKEQ
jgi:hypothetical protein